MPAASFVTTQASPLGSTARSSVLLATSMPTKRSISPSRNGRHGPALRDSGFGAQATVRARDDPTGGAPANPRAHGPRRGRATTGTKPSPSRHNQTYKEEGAGHKAVLIAVTA